MNKCILWLCSTIFMIALSCHSKDEKESVYYGDTSSDVVDRRSYLNLNEYETYDVLLDRIEVLACSDSLPVVVLHDNHNEILVELDNPCLEGVACILIKSKNLLQIVDNKILATQSYEFSDLQSLMTKHYGNYGKVPIYSDDPQSLVISVEYSGIGFEGLADVLRAVVRAYDDIDIDEGLRIWLRKYIPPPPPDIPLK